VISKVTQIMIGTDELLNVRSIDWKENNTLVNIAIPGGSMIYQDLIPHVIEGTILCLDIASIWVCFYDSDLVNEETGRKTVFSVDGDEFILTAKDITGTNVVFNFYNVRIISIDPSPMTELSTEVVWTIRFTASRVEKQ